MKCVETRRRPNCLKWRRYRAEHGESVQTIELPIQVLRGLTPLRKLQVRMDAWRRNQERLQVKARAMGLLDQGWKPLAIAHELGLNVRTVERYRKGER